MMLRQMLSRSAHNGRRLVKPYKCVSVHLFSTQQQPAEETKKPLNFKGLWKKYGYVAIGTYFTIYFGTLGTMFVTLDLDLLSAASFGLNPVTAIAKACDVFETVTGSTSLPEYIRLHPQAGTFALAWVITKVLEPLRLAVTIAAVPSIAKVLQRRRDDQAIAEEKKESESGKKKC